MNCDAVYDDGGNPPNPYATQDVVRGVFDTSTGIAERTEPNLRLSPGIYTFYQDVTPHSGSILSAPPASQTENYFAWRYPVDVFAETIFEAIPDYCPP